MSEGKITLWTSQDVRVYQSLQRGETYTVKKEYVKEKFGEVAWIFLEAYGYLGKMAAAQMEKPEGSESLIWTFRDRKWVKKEGDSVVMKLEVPVDQVLLFNLNKWNKILNLSFIGEAREEEQFASELAKMGIKDTLEVFRSSFYPVQKRKIIDSWKSVFDLQGISDEYIQGGLWEIQPSWVTEVL